MSKDNTELTRVVAFVPQKDIAAFRRSCRKVGLAGRAFYLDDFKDRCKKLLSLTRSENSRWLILDGMRPIAGLQSLRSQMQSIAISAEGTALYMIANRESRLFLYQMIKMAAESKVESWSALVRAAYDAERKAGRSIGEVNDGGGVVDAGIPAPAENQEDLPALSSQPPEPTAQQVKTLLLKWSAEAEEAGKPAEAAVYFAKAVDHGYDDPAAPYQLAKLYLRAEQPAAAGRALRRLLGKSLVQDSEAQTILLTSAKMAGDVQSARQIAERLLKLGEPSGVAYARSVLFELDLDRRAAEAGFADEARPGLWWMAGPYPGNFGDILNPYVVERLSGIPPKRARAGSGILAIGSVIKFARHGTQVWGTGTPRMTDKLDPNANYRAVRGPMTRDLVLKSGGQAPEIYGDPALLLPLIFKPAVEKKHRLGLIRHYSHIPIPLKLQNVHDISILRVGYDDIEEFISEMMACERILSTSLHGLIVAHAYGIPTRWCDMGKMGRRVAGDGIKFHDHYATLGISTEGPLDLSAFDVISDQLAELCTEVATKPVNADKLLEAAPFAVLPSILAAARHLTIPEALSRTADRLLGTPA
jgi:hypothetical protein